MNYNRADARSCCGAKQEPAGRRGVVWCAISPATGIGRSSPSGRDATKLRTGNWNGFAAAAAAAAADWATEFARRRPQAGHDRLE